ncbi:hypothetical protein TNCV_824291 [Trichonephila clavipes]|nr:hypothetical protein TNCV_824291 [Trichonephila clavipes]
MPLDNKCRIGRCASRHVSALRLRDSSLKMTRLQSVTLQVARGRQNPVDTAYDVGSVVSVLADVGSLKPTSVSRLLMVSLDGTGCLENVESISESGHSSDCTILAIICVPGTS